MNTIVFILTALFDAYLLFVLFNCFMSSKIKRLQHLITLFCFGIFILLSNFLIIDPYFRLLACTAYAFVYALFGYNSGIIMKLFVCVFFASIIMVGELFAYGSVGLIDQWINLNNWEFTIGALSSYVFLFAFILIVNKTRLIIHGPVQKSSQIILIGFPFTCALTVVFFLQFLNMHKIAIPFFAFLIVGVFFLLLNVSIVKFCKILSQSQEQLMANTVLSTQINQYDTYVVSLIKYGEMIRSYRHDIRHFQSVLQNLAINKDIKGIQDFLDDLDDYSPKNEVMYTGNMIADIMVHNAIENSRDSGIIINVDACIPSELNIRNADLCVVLGNSLENAIEACLQIESSKKEISVRLFMRRNTLFIEIKNPLIGDLNIVNGYPLSTKHDTQNHGQGIKNINSIADKYDGHMNYWIKDGSFTIVCMLNLKPKNR